MSDPLKPSMTLLVKLGSIAVHVEEILSPQGHSFDKAALDTVLKDSEVKAWITAMDEMALLPRKR
jgi:hypothetical protein